MPELTKFLGLYDRILTGDELEDLLPHEFDGSYVIDTIRDEGYLNFRDHEIPGNMECFALDNPRCHLSVGKILSKDVAAKLCLMGVLFDTRLIKE